VPKENLIICAPKIKALAENFEAVKLMVGATPSTSPGSVPDSEVVDFTYY